MRICILGPAPPFRGGISLFALHLGKTLRKLGHEVSFQSFSRQYPAFLFPGKAQTDAALDSDGITVERTLTPWLPWTWEHTVKSIVSARTDLLIISWFLPFFAPAYAYVLKRLKNTRKVVLAHNVSAHEKWALADTLTGLVFNAADHIVVLSKASLKELDKVVPLRTARKAVLGFHPIYSHSGQASRYEHHKTRTILFFGLIKPYKGLDVLLASLPEAVKAFPDLKLVIAGEVYGDSSIYEKQIDTLGIRKWVDCRFRYISENELGELFAQAGLCVLPYKSASQSGVIATSYSFGVPVLASDVGGLGEYVEAGFTGYLVQPNSPHLLAEAIVRHFSEMPDMQDNIIEYCRRFSWQNLAELILKP